MKTTAQIYDQRQRIFRKAMRLGKRCAAMADPRTDGSELLVGNWGNAESKAAWERAWSRWRRIATVADEAYRRAEHRNHGRRFRPLWCSFCRED